VNIANKFNPTSVLGWTWLPGTLEQEKFCFSEKESLLSGVGPVAQVVACLRTKCRALSSNLSTVKKKKKPFGMSLLILFLLRTLL
jgi:hypothetical protein